MRGEFQAKLMKALEEELEGADKATKFIQDLYDCDYSTARRKFNGDIKLGLEQFAKLAKRFPRILNLAFHEFLPPDTYLVHYSSFRNFREVNKYLGEVIRRFEKGLAKGALLKYVARDLPLFFFLSDRKLAGFKIALWANQLNQQGPFNLGIETYHLCRELYRLYKNIDSLEIWNRNVLVNQFHMIDWYCQLRHIDGNFKAYLFEVIENRIRELRTWSGQGKKDGMGNLNILFTDFITMNNGGMLQTDKEQVLMTAVSNVNYITFKQGVPCVNFLREFEIHQSYATSISRSNALSREKIFKQLLEDLQGGGKT